jgi:hypothetical protein
MGKKQFLGTGLTQPNVTRQRRTKIRITRRDACFNTISFGQPLGEEAGSG